MSSIFRQKNSRFFWVKYRDIDGKIKRESLKTAHRGVALKKKALIDQRVKIGKPKADNSLKSLIDRYLETLKPSVSQKHFCNVRTRLEKFYNYAKITNADQITIDRVQRFILSLKCAPGTVSGYKRCLSGFCSFLVNRSILHDNPCRNIKLPKQISLPPRYLDETETEIALKISREQKIYLPVLTALKTGMRMTEIRKLEWPDVHFRQNLIVIPRTKTNRPRSVPLHPELAEELARIAKKTGPVFLGQKGGFVGEKQWKVLLKPLQDKIPKFNERKGTGSAWHLLRSSFASRYMQAGGNIYRLAKILGHSTVKTTEIYAHLAPTYDPDIEKV